MSRKIIGSNLKKLRQAIGISQIDLGDLLLISKRSIANIEAGVEFDTFDVINTLLQFYGLTVNDVGYHDYKISEDFRDIIIQKHNDQAEYVVLLSKKPSIPFAIKSKLLNSTYLDEPKEINEIKDFFDKIGWQWNGSSISTALKRMENRGIIISAHPFKGGTTIFKKQTNYQG